MTVVNLVFSKREQVGKTFVTWLLSQYKSVHSQKFKLFEFDNNLNKNLSRFKALNTLLLNGEDSVNNLLSAIKSSYHDLIADIPASLFTDVLSALKNNDFALIKELESKNFKIVLHYVVGGNEFVCRDCIDYANKILNDFKQTSTIIWINHYPKELFNDIYSHDELYQIFEDKGSLKYIVDLPRLTSGETITRDNDYYLLNLIYGEGKTFAEILNPAKYKSAQSPVLNDLPVFILTDYQISFLLDEFERTIAPIAEVVF